MIQTRRSTRFGASRSRWLAVALPVLLTAAGALAPCVAAADDAEEAKQQFSRAQTAYKLGRFSEAIEAYEAAYRALPEPAFLFNIAQACRQQYLLDKKVPNLQKALALYKTYLRETKEPPNRTVVVKLIDELRAILADVEREAEQRQRDGKLVLAAGRGASGAAVDLDGSAVGLLPLSRQVAAGAHYLQVRKEGFRPWSSTLTVGPSAEVRVEVSLLPLGAGAGASEAGARRVDRAPPFYKRWWFWTAVGAVAVAGAATGVYLGTRDDGAAALPLIDLRK